MTREEAISVLEESKRQNEIMRDNPNTFFKVSDIVTGEKNAQKRIDALNMAISALRQQDHFREVTKKVEPLTNAQKIRAMSDEELAEFIKHIKVRAAFCKAVKDNDAFEALCSAEWLKQPAEEDKHETM